MLSNLFKKKPTPQNERYHIFTVREVKRETDQALTLVFEQNVSDFPYKAGQYLTLIFEIDGAEHRRSYSLSSSPQIEQYLAVTIKQLEGGKVSNYIFHKIKKGDAIKVMPPMGNFCLEVQPKSDQSFVFIGAGSGITPLMSMIKTALHTGPKSKLMLVYGNKNENDVIFRDELSALEQQHPGRLEVIHVYSRVEQHDDAYIGRINGSLLHELLHEREKETMAKAEFFLCGPAGMMQESKAAIADLGVSEKQIHQESFVTASTEKRPEKEASADYVVTILLDGETHEVKVPADKSILKAGLDEGLDMPFSCQSGICTACRGKLLSGEIEMEEDEGLTEDEIKEGYVLCCVGHPKTEDVRIEIC